MYIDMNTIVDAGKVITAIGIIAGVIFGAYKWYLKQENLNKKVEKLEGKHDGDMKKIEEEACLHTYGILACLKGLQEKGCNGPVTEAIDKFEKYINKRAHDQDE